MSFDIRQHVTFDQSGRGQCPSCLSQGKTGLNLQVTNGGKYDGAYKCWASCKPSDIRAALGQSAPQPDRQLPPMTVAATTSRPVTVKEDRIDKAHATLIEKSTKALAWLTARGIGPDAIKHYRLGITRARVGDSTTKSGFKHLPSITIPIPAGGDKFYQKKRVSPWLEKDERPDGYRPWSQYGIPQQTFITHQPDNLDGIKQTWHCEGEWDAIALGWLVRNSEIADKVQVSCFTCGAGNVAPDAADKFHGNIIVFYDRDKAGEMGAAKLQDQFRDRCFIATVPAPEEAPEGWDITDALELGTDLHTFCHAANKARKWQEPKAENPLRERLQTNAQLIATAPDHIEWLVPDLLTEDELFILAAPPRGGKSIFAMTLAKAIATGSKFLGRPTTQGSVLYVNCEDSPAKVRTRQESMGWAEDLPVYWMDKFKLSELEHLAALIDELPDLRLIVLDTLSRVRDDNNKESSAELSRVLEPLQELAKNQGLCILSTHHTGKMGDVDRTDPFDALRGSSAIRATARGVMMIMPGENSHRLLSENGHVEKLDLSIRLNPATIEWQMLGNWNPGVNQSLKDEILEHLNRVGQGTVSQIATELGRNARSVGNALSKLHGDEMVTKKSGKGRVPATYARSFTLLHTNDVCEASGEACDVDSESVSALLHQKPHRSDPPENVIISAKGDQNLDHHDHLLGTTGGKAVKQSANPDGVKDVCFTTPCETSELCEAKGSKIVVGDLVKCATTSRRYRLCGEKQLEVLDVTDKGNARVKHAGWNIARTIPLDELIKLTH